MTIIYTNQSSGRKKPSNSKRLAQARAAHGEFLKTIGYTKPLRGMSYSFPDLSVKVVSPTSDNLYVAGGYKRTIDDYKWRKGQTESKETIEAIERKKKQIVIPYNKGPTMLLNRSDDLSSIGKKV
jgi:hypothetical protein